ncbi:MAG: hypothetical protein JRM72_04000 [Nitrososphaerota archaeon]|jgi:hypothetical protein|nr:hypothetical protein [Nitrososphaerota archaeon]
MEQKTDGAGRKKGGMKEKEERSKRGEKGLGGAQKKEERTDDPLRCISKTGRRSNGPF